MGGLFVLQRLGGGRRYLVDVGRGVSIVLTVDGFVSVKEVLEAGPGGIVRSSNGAEYVVLAPGPEDVHGFLTRRSQIIYPKDLAVIAMLLDVKPCTRMMQAGVGTGYSLAYFARILGECGVVDGYEVRDDMIRVARENIRRLGLAGRVNIYKADITAREPGGCYDHALLDLPRPEDALPLLADHLKPGAPVAVYTPTISQVERLARALQGSRFFHLTRTVEVSMRDWQVKPGAVRPTRQPYSHTGFITLIHRIRGGCAG